MIVRGSFVNISRYIGRDSSVNMYRCIGRGSPVNMYRCKFKSATALMKSFNYSFYLL